MFGHVSIVCLKPGATCARRHRLQMSRSCGAQPRCRGDELSLATASGQSGSLLTRLCGAGDRCSSPSESATSRLPRARTRRLGRALAHRTIGQPSSVEQSTSGQRRQWTSTVSAALSTVTVCASPHLAGGTARSAGGANLALQHSGISIYPEQFLDSGTHRERWARIRAARS